MQSRAEAITDFEKARARGDTRAMADAQRRAREATHAVLAAGPRQSEQDRASLSRVWERLRKAVRP